MLGKWEREAGVWRGLRGAWEGCWGAGAVGADVGAVDVCMRSPRGPVGAFGIPGPGREDAAADGAPLCWGASSSEGITSPVSGEVE